ncbi:hypothetical protein [Rhizobium leguminosarum]|uniref:hypothetical protein n=1 Tax=Rhizobium leguminosarum TaxID=384 RepID=UPI003ECC5494
MLLPTETWRIFLLNSKVIGDPHGASLKVYCGLFGSNIIAGYGRWRDTVTPYAYGISDFLDLIGDQRDKPDDRLCVMPKNKAVRTYLVEFVPLWRERGLNGLGEVPWGRDEWIRVADQYAGNKFFLGTDYKAFKDAGLKINLLLDQIGLMAEQKPVKEGQVVRLTGAALNLERERD